MKVVYFESESIFLSNIDKGNVNDLISYLNHSDIRYRRYIPWKFDEQILTQEDGLDIINEWKNNKKSRIFGIFLKDSSELVGHATFNYSWDIHAPFFAVVLHPKLWRKGIGTNIAKLLMKYIFDNNPVHNLNSSADSWNVEANRFLESLGFTKTGEMRRTSFKDEKYVNTNIYDILRTEWSSK